MEGKKKKQEQRVNIGETEHRDCSAKRKRKQTAGPTQKHTSCKQDEIGTHTCR
jgi:hypothetical protein